MSTSDMDLRLQPGEKLLWQGQPEPIAYALDKTVPGALALPFIIPVFMYCMYVYHGGGMPPWALATLDATLYPLAVAEIYKLTRFHARLITYTITDRRIILDYARYPSTKMNRAQIAISSVAPSLHGGAKDTGTIRLGVGAYKLLDRATRPLIHHSDKRGSII